MARIEFIGLIGIAVGISSVFFPLLWFRVDFPNYFVTNSLSIAETYLPIPLAMSLSLSLFFTLRGGKWSPHILFLSAMFNWAMASYAFLENHMLIHQFLSSKSLIGDYEITTVSPSTGWFVLLFSGATLSMPMCRNIAPYVGSFGMNHASRKVRLVWLVPVAFALIVSFIRSPFLLSGLGMVIVGGSSILYWKNRTTVTSEFFGFGAAAWGLTVALKAAFATAFNQPVAGAMYTFLPLSLADPLLWLYIGLLTGAFECGGVFLLTSKTRLRKMGWTEATAFGVGFGAMEAMLLGLISYASTFPSPAPELSPLIIPAPVVERIAATFIHVFSNVLIVLAVQSGRWAYFLESFFYKTAVDSVAAFGHLSYGIESLSHIYTLELIFAFFGVVGLLGLDQLKRKFEVTQPYRPKNKGDTL